MLYGKRKFVAPLSLLLFVSVGSLLAQREAGVSGTVRDSRGRPQMGVLVELLGPATTTAALTDLRGHYQINNILPGVYQLRATAALYLPGLRRQLRIQPKMRPVVNLTVSGLFDETSWMSASRPGREDETDDWKWTLRSPANRPLLRLVHHDPASAAANAEQQHGRLETHGALTLRSAQGEFGSPNNTTTLTVVRRSRDQQSAITVRSMAGAAQPGSSESPLLLSALLETDSDSGIERRASVQVRSFPQVRTSQGDSLSEFVSGSAERLRIGDLAALEIGTEAQFLNMGSSVLVDHPFVRLTSRPLAGWTTSYAFATSPALSHYEDVGRDSSTAPSAVPTQHRLLTEAGLHQEVVARRAVGRTKVQLLYEHTAVSRTAISGKALSVRDEAVPQRSTATGPDGVAIDSSNGTFRVFAPGMSAHGFGLAIDLPLGSDVALSGGYLSSAGISLPSISQRGNANPFSVSRANVFLASIIGHVAKSGTRMSVTYRWQPDDVVSTVSPYEMVEVKPYLGIHLHQSIPAMRGLPAGIEASVDGENVLGEGYQNYALARQEAILASTLRELRAGLSFTF